MRVLKGLWASFWYLAIIALAMLVPAELVPGGTWRWPSAWLFLAVYGGVAVVGTVALAVLRPASYQVRQQGLVAGKAKKQPLLDAVGTVIFVAYLAAWIAFIPADVFWLKLLPAPPPPLAWLGFAAILAGTVIAFLAVAENQFAAPTVQDQRDAGQTVIDTGPYAVVRHPLYTGNLLAFVGMALWLGSYAALIGVALIVGFIFARMHIEERWLRANLDGYEDYARRVRARLIPFLV